MLNYIAQLFQYSNDSLFAAAKHDPWLVILSISIAIFASFMGFQVASQASGRSFYRKQLSLLAGSIALGGGVWSMHFIGMLALEICTPITYQFNITAISLLPAVLASWVALSLITQGELKWFQLVIGGVLVGAGIGTMHYVGMAGMQMAPLLRYDLVMFLVSILVAVILAILSLWIRFGLDQMGPISLTNNQKMAISSCIMGCAISGMHYTGMAAARFVLPPGFEASKQGSEISFYLALGITSITIFIISVVLAANLVFRYKDLSAVSKRNERRLEATMDTAVDSIITINDKGIIESVNKAVTKLLGWESEELLGQHLKVIIPETLGDTHNQYITNYLKTGIAKIIGTDRELDVITKSGEAIPVRIGVGHVELDNQHMFVAFISDLREKLKMEAAIRENELRIRSILTNIPGIAYRCLDVAGWPNLFINDEVEKITGYPAKDFLLPNAKRSLGDFVHPEDFSIIEATDLHDPNGYQIEFRLIDRYKTVKWMLGYGRASKSETSDEYYLDGFIMDISDRKEMESKMLAAKIKAEKAVETRSAFLANMSHEIRTPMNAVIGFSDILLDEQLSNKHRKHLTTINQSAKSLLHILNDLLDSAKLEKGKFQLEYRDFSLVEEVDSVVSTLWLEAESKGLNLDLKINAQAQGYFNGAPDRIRQVLTNLVGNAIKFTEKGTVGICINKMTDNTVKFVIRDTGIGMTEKQLATIFDAFAQADESMSRRFGGTGLGTTISKQLVELMGGNITAKSIKDAGSEFSFTLPLKPVAHLNKAAKEEVHEPLPKLNVLVVDDIDQNIELLTLILKRNGHKISEARDGEQALVQMQNNPIDLVLMDIQMPVMDGLTAVKLRREYEQENNLPRIPVIALTASVLPQDRLSAEEAGMDGFANKPIDIMQLMNEMSCVMNLHRPAVAPKKMVDSSTLKIDENAGIALWGDKTTYYTEIARFIKSNETEIFELDVLAEQQNWQALEQAAHKFKGSTGNLSLNRFMALLAHLERSSKAEDLSQSLENIKNIKFEFITIKDCIIKKKIDIYADNEVNENSITELIETLKQLQEHVNNNSFDDGLLEQLESMGAYKSTELNAIVNACNDFEFSRADELITSLLVELASDE